MMQVTYHLEQFDGPLDLLLHLISKNKINIYDIPISEILEQYLEQIREMESLNLEVASAFIAMAAQLMYIKSKMLLPVYEEEEEADPREQLVAALLEYQKYKRISGILEHRSELGCDLYTKPPELLPFQKVTYDYQPDVLARALEAMLSRFSQKEPPPLRLFSGVVGHEPVPVSAKIERIIQQLAKYHSADFEQLVMECKSRSEVVSLFLAVLELSKAHKLQIIEEKDGYLLSLAGE